jgi:hypothetical protein
MSCTSNMDDEWTFGNQNQQHCFGYVLCACTWTWLPPRFIFVTQSLKT